MLSTGTLNNDLEEISSFLLFIWRNAACITIKRDGVKCSYSNRDKCIFCLSDEALNKKVSHRINLVDKIIERIQAGDECLYEEKEYL